MSDFLLLKQKQICPACYHKAVASSGHCNHCGVHLFFRPIDFHRYEEDGHVRNYWLWDSHKGWVHRDFVMMPEVAPLIRKYKPEPVPDGYGTHTTPQQVAKQGLKLKRKTNAL